MGLRKMGMLGRLKIKLLVWLMITFRLKAKALPGFNAAKIIQEERDNDYG
jgi:hypothetical protein